MAKLILTVKGMPGTIYLDSFLMVINNSFLILKDLDSAISLQPRGSLDWIIADIHVGSLGVEIQSKPRDPTRDYGAKVAETYLDGIDIIHEEGVTPPYFSDSSLRLLQKVARALGRNGADALEVYDPAREKTTEIDAEIEITASQLRGSRYKSFGSVEGTLEMISIHREPRFNVYHAISLRAVKCSLPDEMRKTVASALGRRVIASGLMSYNAKDEPITIVVEELKIIPTEDALPSIEEFIGSDPNFTGDMTTGEYIRSIRSG